MGPCTSRNTIFILNGKGDRKKKNKKSSGNNPSSSTSNAPSDPTTSPLRVSSNSNIPVRQQIRWAQMKKEYNKQVGAGFRQKVVRTKYRRSWDEDELEQKAEERKRRGQDPNWDLILNRRSSSPLVIVDAYNIIHKWPRLKKHMARGDPQRARQLLVEDLENMRSLKGWRIECVFDGTGKSIVGPLGVGAAGKDTATGMDRATKFDVSRHGVRIVFTGVGVEADTYIESRCAQAKNSTEGEYTSSFIVASDDGMIKVAAQNAGALSMSAERFVTELKATKRALEDRVEMAVSRVNGHAFRPEQLRKMKYQPFGRRSVLIEDKRNRTKTNASSDEPEIDIQLDIDEEDLQGIPWWAQLPNRTDTKNYV